MLVIVEELKYKQYISTVKANDYLGKDDLMLRQVHEKHLISEAEANVIN